MGKKFASKTGSASLLAIGIALQAFSSFASFDSYASLYGQLHAIETTIRPTKQEFSKPGTGFVPVLGVTPRASLLPPMPKAACNPQLIPASLFSSRAFPFSGSRMECNHPFRTTPAQPGLTSLSMASTGKLKKMPPATRDSTVHDGSPATSRSKVLVLNASYEPIAIVSACRALALLWNEKASLVVPRDRTWTSCGGEAVTIPSVVSLRRYIKVRPRIPPPNRRTILLRDEGVCQYCSAQAENVDHVIPRSKGGMHRWDNVVACCKACNSRKADKFLKDLDMKLKRKPAEPTNICWVHNAVWKVEPCWRPYVGQLLWEDLHAQLPQTKSAKQQRKVNKHKKKTNKSKKVPAKPKLKTKANTAQANSEADSVIAAYTKPE